MNSVKQIESVLGKLSLPTKSMKSVTELNRGISGSIIYKLEFPKESYVLKLTPEASPQYVTQRALREHSFYTRLAHSLPILVPELVVSLIDKEIGIAMLFRAYLSAPKTADWQAEQFEKAIDMIASVHSAFWKNTSELEKHTWIKRESTQVPPTIKDAAIKAWEGLLHNFEDNSSKYSRAFSQIVNLIQDAEHIMSIEGTFPRTLCHGDFHIDNFLMDTDCNLVLSDWQEVCIGRSPEDISFFIQRAEASEADIKRDHLLSSYVNALNNKIDIEINIDSVRQVVDASELFTILIHWPHYLESASEEVVWSFIERIEVNANRLGLI